MFENYNLVQLLSFYGYATAPVGLQNQEKLLLPIIICAGHIPHDGYSRGSPCHREVPRRVTLRFSISYGHPGMCYGRGITY